MFDPGSPQKQLATLVAEYVHKDKPLDAAKAVNEVCKLGLKLENNPKSYNPVLSHYLHYLLNNGAPEEAAQMLWTPTQFTPEPQFTKDLWKLFDSSTTGLIMGAASCSKSYGMGVRLFLEWVRDPEYTSIKVIGPNEDHLETNLFSHLVGLHQKAKLPMPGSVGELFIGMDRRNQSSAIKGVVIPVGKVKKAGRLQGTKRTPRPNPHPIFGPLGRLFIFIDEIENVPGGLWSDIDNVLANVDGEDYKGLKIFGAYNPTNQSDEVGKRAEPPTGWENFDPDTHYRWKSKRGWEVLRLDGEKSENVIQNKVIYPGLQTRAGLEQIALNAGGKNTPGYHTMGRGAYPPTGIELVVCSPHLIAKIKGTFIWIDEPQPVAGCDLALEGRDSALFTLGKFGKASGMNLPPSLEYPTGRKIMFKDRNGHNSPRWAAQADQQFRLPKGSTREMAERIIKLNKSAGVRPQFFACDRTGIGSGVADLIKDDWGKEIHDVNYSEACSDTKLMIEDSKTCKEAYERMNSELWFALRSYAEFGYLLLNPEIDMTVLGQQLTQRKYRTAGSKSRVESKKDYTSRGFDSPDEADSLTLFLHAVRKGSAIILSMKGENNMDVGEDGGPDGWHEEIEMKNGVYLDAASRNDYLPSEQ